MTLILDSPDVRGFYRERFYFKSDSPVIFSGHTRFLDADKSSVLNHQVQLEEVTAEEYAREMEHARDNKEFGDFENFPSIK